MDQGFTIEPDPGQFPKIAGGAQMTFAGPAGFEDSQPFHFKNQGDNASFNGIFDGVAGQRLRRFGTRTRAHTIAGR